MNETNIKHGYSLMVCDAMGAILNPGTQISKAGAVFMPPGSVRVFKDFDYAVIIIKVKVLLSYIPN